MFTKLFTNTSLLNAGIVGFESNNVDRDLTGGQYINMVTNNWVMVIIALGLGLALFSAISFASKLNDKKFDQYSKDVDNAIREARRANESLQRDSDNSRNESKRLIDRVDNDTFEQVNSVNQLLKERRLSSVSYKDPRNESSEPQNGGRSKKK